MTTWSERGMTTTEVLPDVDVDESELTQQPCATVYYGEPCDRPSVGEDLMRCDRGHEYHVPCCEKHLGTDNSSHGTVCGRCLPTVTPTHLIVSRYYRSAS